MLNLRRGTQVLYVGILLGFPILLFSSISLHVHLRRLSYLSLLFSGTVHSVGHNFPFPLCLSLLFSQLSVRQIWGKSGNSDRFFGGGGSKITVDVDWSHEIKICLLLGRKAMTNLDSI